VLALSKKMGISASEIARRCIKKELEFFASNKKEGWLDILR